MEGVHPAVCARLPLLGQPWLELERRPIDANEPSLREAVEELGRLIRRHHPIERARGRPIGADDLPTAFRGYGAVACLAGRRTTTHEEEGGQQSSRDSETEVARRSLDSSSNRVGLIGAAAIADQS